MKSTQELQDIAETLADELPLGRLDPVDQELLKTHYILGFVVGYGMGSNDTFRYVRDSSDVGCRHPDTGEAGHVAAPTRKDFAEWVSKYHDRMKYSVKRKTYGIEIISRFIMSFNSRNGTDYSYTSFPFLRALKDSVDASYIFYPPTTKNILDLLKQTEKQGD